mgnify:FL=1
MVETKQTEERVILVAVRQSDDDNTDRSLDELEELASTYKKNIKIIKEVKEHEE